MLEQLVLARLLADPAPVIEPHRARLREQRDALAAMPCASGCPSGGSAPPGGGLALWCELPAALGTAVAAEAERRGVIVAPGPLFAAEGGLDQFVRIPWSRPADELAEAVRRLAAAWDAVRDRQETGTRATGRVMVA